MTRRDPLRPWIYPSRRPGRAVPVALVIALATLLLVVVITPGNTFRATLEADLAALRTFTVVAPARQPGFDAGLRETLDRNPHARRWTPVHAIWVRYPTMIGEGSCPLILARPEEVRTFVDRLGLRLVAGRFPSGSERALVLHEDVARARGIGVGSQIGTLVDPDDNIPGRFEVVGLLRGPARAAGGTVGEGVLASMLHARLPLFALVDARAGEKGGSDGYLRDARDGTGPAFQVIDADYARTRAERALRNLPLLVGFISTASASIVAIVVMLLSVVTFQSRVADFAVLLAIGQRRGRLLRSLALELAILAVGAWIAGAALGLLGLGIYDAVALRPRGILLHVWDPAALLATAAIPILVVAAGIAALDRTLARIDPVTVISRCVR